MSTAFENYARRAEANLSFASISGRYSIQHEGMKRAVLDIAKKLDLQPTDDFLDVGCGAGDMTIPLSMLAGTTTCVDHEKVLGLMKERFPKDELRLLPGNFLEVTIDNLFSKVLCYGVVLCLPDRPVVLKFIDKLASLIAPGGRALVGDLPTLGKKERFLNSAKGRAFSSEWERLMKDPRNQEELDWAKKNLETATAAASFDDEFVTELLLRYRKQGFDAYLLPQPADLAFGNTREDLLLVRPE